MQSKNLWAIFFFFFLEKSRYFSYFTYEKIIDQNLDPSFFIGSDPIYRDWNPILFP